MEEIIAVSGAITNASKLKSALEKKGCINCRISHTPSKISSGGCSYSVYLSKKCLPILLNTISECNIRTKGIYRRYMKDGKDFYYDLSG